MTEYEFNELWFQHESTIKRFVLSLIGRQDSSDLYHDVYMRAWKSRNQLKDVEKFKAWIFQIAKNKAKNMFRSRNRSISCDFEMIDSLLKSYDDPGMDINNIYIKDVLDALPDDFRRMIYMNVFWGMTINEIATFTKTSYYVIKNRINKAKRLLAQSIDLQNTDGEV